MIDLRIRLPDEVRGWLKAQAERHHRSMNGQLIAILKNEMAAQAATASEETGASVSQTSAPASRVKPEDRI